MKSSAHKWVCGALAALWTVTTAAAVLAVEAAKVTDRDRVFRNFTREAAIVDDGQLRLEVRGMRMTEESAGHNSTPPGRCHGGSHNGALRENCARLDLQGQRILGVESLDGGIIDLVVSYGLPNSELGLILPGYIETLHRDDGTSETAEDIGDITLYGKFKVAVHEMVSVAGGLELTIPSGPTDKIKTIPSGTSSRIEEGTTSGFGTGALGINPFVSSRFAWGPLGVESHIGYNFYTSNNIEKVFNWSAAGLLRGGESWAFRAEFSGRVWDQFGTTWVDVVCLPGIDFQLSNSVTFRPTGMANITGTALDWGMGAGIAAVF